MNFIFISYCIVFLIPVFGFTLGSGGFTALRNYQYIVVFLSIILALLNKKGFIKNNFFCFTPPNKIISFTLIFSSLLTYLSDSLSQYYSIQISGIDFSIFEGLLHEALKGNLGFESITQTYHFGVHQNWILFLILPIYAIFPSPILLVLIGSFIMWLPGLLILYIAKTLKHDSFIAYLSAICWWTSTFTVQAFHGSFYPEFFYPLFIFSILIFYLKNHFFLFCLSTLLCLSVKEDAAIYLIFFILSITLKNLKTNKIPIKVLIILITLCLFLLIFNLFIIKPYFLHKQNVQEPPYLSAWWGYWGNSPSEILKNIINQPFTALKTIFFSNGWKELYLPMLLIPLFNFEVLVTSMPFIILYGISTGNPSNYVGYYPLILWCLALYGLLKNNFVPKSFMIVLILILPLWHSAWLEVNKIDWQAWKNLNLYKNQMISGKIYCLHEGLWPYLSSMSINSKPFSNSTKEYCSPVFSLKANPYPQDKNTIKNLYENLKDKHCIEYQLGEIIEVKNSIECKKIIKFN